MIVMTLVIATSTISMILTENNFSNAKLGIENCFLSISRLNAVAYARFGIRILIYIAN